MVLVTEDVSAFYTLFFDLCDETSYVTLFILTTIYVVCLCIGLVSYACIEHAQ